MGVAILIVLMVATLISGLTAAWLWGRASKVNVVPSWKIEPGYAEASMSGWLSGAIAAFAASGRLNKLAAIWTAASVICGTAANLYGTYLTFFK